MGGKKEYELLLEIGHKSAPLKKPTADGYTHKWTVYLKGVNDAKLEHCISRVVFQLHDSFDNPNRVKLEPPYQVKETGYACFELPIEVYFKNKEKPNHVVYVHNLVLLAGVPHVASHVEKVMFINPNKDFERCLIRAGAQLHPSRSSKNKKDRSESPPSKKRKSASSSLIPSKDIGQLNLQVQTNGHQSNHHHSSSHNNHSSSSSQHQHSKPSQYLSGQLHTSNSVNGTSCTSSNGSSHSSINRSNTHTTTSNYNNSGSSGHNYSNQQQPTNSHSSTTNLQSQSSTVNQLQKLSVPKVKSKSGEFMDLFGPPLVYSKKQSTSNDNNNFSTTNNRGSTPETNDNTQYISYTPVTNSRLINKTNHHKPSSINSSIPPAKASNAASADNSSTTSNKSISVHQNSSSSINSNHQRDIVMEQVKLEPSLPDAFQAMQAKISKLTDCDRLQKIVDIIEESGEWFNLTSKKFEFDLKRLDKKTLHRIERCLH